MKNLTFLFMILIAGNLAAQEVYVTLEPSEFLYGAVIHQPIKKFGIYARGQHGNIKENTEYAKFEVTALKGAAGIDLVVYKGLRLLAGVSYTHYYNLIDTSPIVDLCYKYPNSWEIGVIIPYEKINIIAITDPLNWETSIGLTIKLYTLK